MAEGRIDVEKLQMMLTEIIKLEKKFINDKLLNEKNKVSEIKKLIEKEVKIDVD
jgi:hypothetical protein